MYVSRHVSLVDQELLTFHQEHMGSFLVLFKSVLLNIQYSLQCSVIIVSFWDYSISFCHCIICPSIYSFQLPFWYLQTFPTSKENYKISKPESQLHLSICIGNIVSLTISAYRLCSARLYLQLFVEWIMSYLRYQCLLAHITPSFILQRVSNCSTGFTGIVQSLRFSRKDGVKLFCPTLLYTLAVVSNTISFKKKNPDALRPYITLHVPYMVQDIMTFLENLF